MHGFERNCGHGGNHPRDVFGSLAMPAFPVDQVQQGRRGTFQRALRHQERNLHLWDAVREVWSADSPSRTGRRSPALSGEMKFALVRDRPQPTLRGAHLTLL
ncbi:MAG: hypothetical protein OXE85_06545 [Roseovarius sp.]|nr:hypothetical protein [Roseovarius sp.]